MGVLFITDGWWTVGTGVAQIVVKERGGWKVKDCDECTLNRNRSIKSFTSDLVALSNASKCIPMSYVFIVKLKMKAKQAFHLPTRARRLVVRFILVLLSYTQS